MRCLLLCSGAGEPTPVGASVQSLPSGNNRPWFCCPAREHRSPPCAKGGQHGRAMQGGLQSQANDSAGCCDRVREHRLAIPTRDREHRLGAEARRQSLSRRSPTAPFAQGSRLCLSASGLPSAGAAQCLGGHTLPGCMGCGPECSGSAGRGLGEVLAQCRRAKKSPPCAKGGQTAAGGQGGLAECRHTHTALPR